VLGGGKGEIGGEKVALCTFLKEKGGVICHLRKSGRQQVRETNISIDCIKGGEIYVNNNEKRGHASEGEGDVGFLITVGGIVKELGAHLRVEKAALFC